MKAMEQNIQNSIVQDFLKIIKNEHYIERAHH